MKRLALVTLILFSCSSNKTGSGIQDKDIEKSESKTKSGSKAISKKEIIEELDGLEEYIISEAFPDDPHEPYTPKMAEEFGLTVRGETIGDVEIFSMRGNPPPLDISEEAKMYLERYGGWLTWDPDAPEGGQWGWEPREVGCGVFMQYDPSANIAIILTGVHLEGHCRRCAKRVRGKWKWEGCSCEDIKILNQLYATTENRLNRDGHSNHEPNYSYCGETDE